MFQQSSTREVLETGLKYKMSGLTVSKILKTFCPAFDVPQRPIRTNEKRCQMLNLLHYLQHYCT